MDTPLRGTCLAGKALAVSLETTTSLSSERRTITTFTSGLHRHHVSIRSNSLLNSRFMCWAKDIITATFAPSVTAPKAVFWPVPDKDLCSCGQPTLATIRAHSALLFLSDVFSLYLIIVGIFSLFTVHSSEIYSLNSPLFHLVVHFLKAMGCNYILYATTQHRF